MTEKLFRIIRSLSLRFVVSAGVFLLALFLFTAIADEMVLENENQLDKTVFAELRPITNPAITNIMAGVTFFGSSYFLGPAYILLILFFLFIEKNKKLSWNIAAVGISSTIILFSLKNIFHRHRPPDPLIHHVAGFSFPSGHALSSFTFFGLLIYILWTHRVNPVLRWVLSVSFFLFACAIAFSRVYLHVHYASDVIAGFCLCLVWLGVSFAVLRVLDRKNL